MKNIIFTIILLFSTPVFAISVDEIIDKAEKVSYYQGEDGTAKVTMDISDGRQRQFIILRKNYKKRQKVYVYFKRPSDVRKTTFLVHKNITKEDDRWMYLPALDLVKRIVAGDKRTSFMGSNFFYEDVSGRNPHDDNHKLLEETDNFYVLESHPKDKKSTEFLYYKTWIHKDTFIPIKTSYFNNKNEEYRQYEALKVEDIGGKKTVTKSSMKDLKSGIKTNLSYENVSYDIGLEDNIFTERYLKAPPIKWLNK